MMDSRTLAQYMISCTLTTCCGLVVSNQRDALSRIVADGDKADRAAKLIFTKLLGQLVDKHEPTDGDFKHLLDALVEISRGA